MLDLLLVLLRFLLESKEVLADPFFVGSLLFSFACGLLILLAFSTICFCCLDLISVCPFWLY